MTGYPEHGPIGMSFLDGMVYCACGSIVDPIRHINHFTVHGIILTVEDLEHLYQRALRRHRELGYSRLRIIE